MYIKKGRKYNVYALYKGDMFIAEGTLDELSKITGLKKTTIMFYKSPIYKRRNRIGNNKILIKLKNMTVAELCGGGDDYE